METTAIHDRFRHQLTNVHAMTVTTVSVFEIIGYIILVRSKVEYFAISNAYLWYGVVLPIVINAITHFVARAIVNNPDISRQRKNGSIITATLITSFVVAIIHRAYIVTSCAFIFPIILSAMFNDRKLLNISFAVSVLILLFVGVALWLSNEITLVTSINIFVLFGFSFISFLCGIISINFSMQSCSTIESQAALNDKLLQDVLRDQMTGLYNHSAFLGQLKEQAQVHDPLTLLILDVDDFKYINDTYGHDCGDVVLVQLAHIIQAHCGSQDTAYRYGGEEFTVLFPGKAEHEVSAIAEHMLRAFRDYQFPFTERAITFSAGIARYEPGATCNDFFELADKTLYKAKRAGKNRVLIAQ